MRFKDSVIKNNGFKLFSLLSLMLLARTSLGANCAFDSNRPDSVYLKASCETGEHLGKMVKAQQLSIDQSIAVCQKGISNETLSEQSVDQASLMQLHIFSSNLNMKVSENNLAESNALVVLCLSGLTSALSQTVEPKILPPRTEFTSAVRHAGKSFMSDCRMNASSPKYEDAIIIATTNAKGDCATAGYSICEVEDEPANLSRCVVQVAVVGRSSVH